MKLFALFALTLSCVLSACGPREPAASPPPAENTSAAAPAPAGSPVPSPTGRKVDLTVEDVGLGTYREDVLKKLGKPSKSSKVKKDYCGVDTHIVLDYPGLMVDFMFDSESGVFTVFEMEVSSPKWHIKPGISIGDDMDTVRAKLGEPTAQTDEAGFTVFDYSNKTYNLLPRLYFMNNKLAKVKIGFIPCVK